MNDAFPLPAAPGPSAVASSLLATLREEHGALGALGQLFEAQIDAVRNRESERLDEVTYRVTEQLASIDRLRQQRDRQVRLLGRVVGESAMAIAPMAERLRQDPATLPVAEELLLVRDQVMSRAKETQKVGQVLAFAIQYAAALGREMMQAVQGVQAPAGMLGYTSAGSKAGAGRRIAYVNQVG